MRQPQFERYQFLDDDFSYGRQVEDRRFHVTAGEISAAGSLGIGFVFCQQNKRIFVRNTARCPMAQQISYPAPPLDDDEIPNRVGNVLDRSVHILDRFLDGD